MVKWRDVWSLELDDIFRSEKIDLSKRIKLLNKIMNSQMMDEVEVKQEVIDKLNKEIPMEHFDKEFKKVK